MTLSQKTQITEMRRRGETYAAIATCLDLSENTIKSFCRRNISICNQMMDDCCPQCGFSLVHLLHKRQKRFCSDKCRLAWWKAHPELLNRKAVYSFVCSTCGKAFTAYGNANRKYCSRACAVTARRDSYE
jgi:endogenous inhibitor of DNA gyrase (YacG/DUF329 family)